MSKALREQLAAIERADPKLFARYARKALKTRNVRGKNGEPNRGSWCTDEGTAHAVGRWDLDPFSNPRSHVLSDAACMLERGDDGFGDGTHGSYKLADIGLLRASELTRVWIQPDYSFVERALAHYGHTRFCALLRFDPRVEWFQKLYRLVELVCVLRKCEFEPPPGVEASSNSFPHALYYARAEDATPAILRKCIAWRTR
ncbi:MAG: hypothetical protein AB7O24_04330 [Kofleriaceae bacterium]